jgi:hypothetical protein
VRVSSRLRSTRADDGPGREIGGGGIGGRWAGVVKAEKAMSAAGSSPRRRRARFDPRAAVARLRSRPGGRRGRCRGGRRSRCALSSVAPPSRQMRSARAWAASTKNRLVEAGEGGERGVGAGATGAGEVAGGGIERAQQWIGHGALAEEIEAAPVSLGVGRRNVQ